ncbi:hypothetical protein PybrP1_007568 [[Pythium] brassicae (nom. inval.)]|nr:hypothetical protein PybrP1_007568 [[Pythium] brassicae (nom. inval.)]
MAAANSSNSSASSGAAVAIHSILKIATSNPDSCTWYANSECTKPRTCYDCLNIAIPSDKKEVLNAMKIDGEGGLRTFAILYGNAPQCAIDPRGKCVTMAEYQSFAKARGYYYPNYKYYPSDSYTYCSALDATCQLCKQKWIQDYNAFGNTPAIPFCTGNDGCVCVAYCELPGWSDTVLGNQCSSSGGDGTDSHKLFGSVGLSVGFIVLFLAVAIGARVVMQRHIWLAATRGGLKLTASAALVLVPSTFPMNREHADSGPAAPRAVGSATEPERLEGHAQQSHRVGAAPRRGPGGASAPGRNADCGARGRRGLPPDVA